MNKEELFELADYITDTYPFIEVRRFYYVVAEQEYHIHIELPDGEDVWVRGRQHWDSEYEAECAAFKEWCERREAADSTS